MRVISSRRWLFHFVTFCSVLVQFAVPILNSSSWCFCRGWSWPNSLAAWQLDRIAPTQGSTSTGSANQSLPFSRFNVAAQKLWPSLVLSHTDEAVQLEINITTMLLEAMRSILPDLPTLQVAMDPGHSLLWQVVLLWTVLSFAASILRSPCETLITFIPLSQESFLLTNR